LFNDSCSNRFQFSDKLPVFLGEELFQLFSDMSSIGGAVSVGADSNLQGASFDDSRDVEIAKLGDIDNIAKDLKLLAILVYLLVELVVVSGCNGKECARQVVLRIGGSYYFNICSGAEGCHHIVDALGDDDNPGAGTKQRLDLSDGDTAGAYHDGATACELEKYGVFCHSLIVLGRIRNSKLEVLAWSRIKVGIEGDGFI